jgi:molybdate transport system substrate-binding protein
MRPYLALVVLAVAVVTGPGTAAAQEQLSLFVAVSLREAIEEIGKRFALDRPGLRLRYTFGASGDLQKQIEGGAPTDVFVSAGPRQVDELEQAGRLVPDSRVVLAGNVLVAIRPTDTALDVPGPSNLLDRRVQKVGIGDPRSVAAGQSAEESLRALGLWERLRPKLVLAESARQVLDQVVRGEVDVGFVYATDAVTRIGRVRLAFAVPENTHRPILHSAAILKATRNLAVARAFIAFLRGAEAQVVIGRLGFEPPPAGGR